MLFCGLVICMEVKNRFCNYRIDILKGEFMKKSILFISTAAIMLAVSVSAYAAETTNSDVSYTDGTLSYNTSEKYQTVLITDDNGGIYYADQAVGTFDALDKLGVKRLVEGITYTMSMYNPSTDNTNKITFELNGQPVGASDFVPAGESVNEDGTKNYGYRLDTPATYKNTAISIQFTYEERPITYYIENLPTLTGGGAIGLQINNVPVDYNSSDIKVTLCDREKQE